MFDKGSEKKQGSGKLIYNVGMEPFTDKNIADGKWITVRGDLYPMMIGPQRSLETGIASRV